MLNVKARTTKNLIFFYYKALQRKKKEYLKASKHSVGSTFEWMNALFMESPPSTKTTQHAFIGSQCETLQPLE